MKKLLIFGLNILMLAALFSSNAHSRHFDPRKESPETKEERKSESQWLKSVIEELKLWAQAKLKPRINGRRILENALEKSGLYVDYVPNRKLEIAEFKAPTDPSDPLYKPSLRGELTVPWREDYLFYNNNMPYVDNHILILGNERQSQNMILEEKTIKDILELQKVFPDQTLFFNHFAGNSLDHFHVHMTTGKMPIERSIFTAHKVAVPSFQGVNAQIFTINACQRGLLLSGSKKELTIAAKQAMDKIVKEGYSFNLIFLPIKNDAQHIVFFIRKSRPVGTPVEGFVSDFSAQHSSITLAGLFVIDRPVSFEKSPEQEFPYLDLKALDEASIKNCEETVIDPMKIFATK